MTKPVTLLQECEELRKVVSYHREKKYWDSKPSHLGSSADGEVFRLTPKGVLTAQASVRLA